MPKPRLPRNINLPERWRWKHNAYFYRVPPGMEPYWDHRQEFLLGKTLEDAMAVYLERMASPKLAEDVGGVLGAASVLRLSAKIPTRGVYFLIKNSRVVYVGRSDNILARLAQHRETGEIDFDRMAWIPAEGLAQVRLEQIYIGKLAPEHNVKHAGKGYENANFMGHGC